MKARPEIESIATAVARRHNRLLVRAIAVPALLIASAVLVVAALFWIPRGYSVPRVVPIVVLLLGVAAAFVRFFAKRMTFSSALPEADRHFALKDGLTSADYLARTAPDEPTTRLQWEWLSPRLAACDPATITSPFPRKLAATAATLALIATILCLIPPSKSVRAAEQLTEETRKRVEESKEELQKLIEELDKDIVAAGEKEGLDMDEFRKMVKDIDETGDRAEAARQFARIERKVRDATRGLDQQRDEETLKLAAKELQKSEDTDARKLGKKLDEKELNEAAELLEKLAAKKFDPKDLKKSPEEKKEALDVAKKDLAKMRAATKPMAAAGEQRQAANKAQGAGAGANAQGGAEGAEGAEGTEGAADGKPLEDMLAELDEAAAEMEENLKKVENDPDAEWDDEAGEEMACAKGQLGKHLKNMHGKRMAKGKLDALRQALAQAQGFCQGKSQQLDQGKGQGKGQGQGSSWSERKERDDSQKNGSLTQLQGQHGDGPSLSAVEDSESGAGVSTRKGSAKERDFTRQMESFVQRDDVPESLKLGVRNYFENLQDAAPEK